jgi:hypothetical protein
MRKEKRRKAKLVPVNESSPRPGPGKVIIGSSLLELFMRFHSIELNAKRKSLPLEDGSLAKLSLASRASVRGFSARYDIGRGSVARIATLIAPLL